MSSQTEFDFVVVGAGAAGCAAAARLSERADVSVLLIEAGRDDPWIWLRVPLGIGIVLTGERALRRYVTEPEPQLNGRSIFWPRGRVLGGTSTVNGMLWVRGDPKEYDDWARNGCDGWDYSSILPILRRIERTALGDAAVRGRSGPVSIVEYGPIDPLTAAFLTACREVGIAHNPDYNGNQYDGAGILQLNTRRGWRHGVREAYFWPARKRKNLTLMTEAVAETIGFSGKRARTVLVRRGDDLITLSARREIVICAGAIDSPKLLQLSGIGDPERLRSVGIAPVLALPGVGVGLRDHLHIRLSYRCTQPVTLNDMLRSPLGKALLGLRYLLRHDGLMATSTSTAHALVRSVPGLDRPDIKIQLHPMSSPDARHPRKLSLDPFPGFGIGVFSLQPKSVGEVMVPSPDARVPPRISANYLDHPDDVVSAIAGVRIARKIADQDALRRFIGEETSPGLKALRDAELLDFIRATGTTSYHPVGTCRMGRDAMAVVTPDLSVVGVAGLRVADASVFPTMPSANTHVASILVGERVADVISAV